MGMNDREKMAKALTLFCKGTRYDWCPFCGHPVDYFLDKDGVALDKDGIAYTWCRCCGDAVSLAKYGYLAGDSASLARNMYRKVYRMWLAGEVSLVAHDPNSVSNKITTEQKCPCCGKTMSVVHTPTIRIHPFDGTMEHAYYGICPRCKGVAPFPGRKCMMPVLVIPFGWSGVPLVKPTGGTEHFARYMREGI